MTKLLPFSPATMLAPMEGVTDPLYRAFIAAGGGVGMLCTEFVRISRAPINPRHLREEVAKFPGVPLSVQIMGNDADRMADAAAIISQAGADVVDINLGCPTRKASKNGVGAAMLKDPQLLYNVLSAMRAEVPGLLSAKIRAGWDNAAHVFTIARAVEDAGADFIVVHPRARSDAYKGVADWRIVAAVKEHVSIPVIGNGDCWYAAEALTLQHATKCDGVMFGRSALRNPWIFQQIEQLNKGENPISPSGEQFAAYIHRLIDLFLEHCHSHGSAIGRVKEHISWLGRTVNDERQFMRQALRSQKLSEMKELVDQLIVPLPAHSLDLHCQGLLRLEKSALYALEQKS